MLTRIHARYIIGYDAAARDHVLCKDAELVFEGDTILFVGHGYTGPVDEELHFGNSVVSPGFIDLNATGDIEPSDMYLDCRGHPSFALGRNWSEAYYDSGPQDLSDPEEEQEKYRYALCRLLSCGTTTILPVTGLLHRKWAEEREEFEELAKTASALGMRTYLGPSFRDGVNVTTAAERLETRWNYEAGRRGLAENAAFVRSIGNDPLIRGALIPSTIETCSKELLLETAKAAEDLNVPVRLHATQSWYEFTAIRERYNRTPVGHLHDVGLLNHRLLLPHAIYLNGYSGADCGRGDDLELLAAGQCTALHCPVVISRSGTCMESFRRFLDRGIRVALATDCDPPDMLHNMQMALTMGRIVDKNASSVTTADVFRAATLAGADALNRPDLGRLHPGCKADITVYSLNSFALNAVDDPVRTLVLSGRGSDVQNVFINGRRVLAGGRIPGVDYAQVKQFGDRYFARLKHSYAQRDYLRRAPDVLFAPSFPLRERQE